MRQLEWTGKEKDVGKKHIKSRAQYVTSLNEHTIYRIEKKCMVLLPLPTRQQTGEREQ